MVYIKNRYGEDKECLYLVETPSFQPKTKEMFFVIMAVGYDGIRRSILFSFHTEEECHKKYQELHEEHLNKRLAEIM